MPQIFTRTLITLALRPFGPNRFRGHSRERLRKFTKLHFWRTAPQQAFADQKGARTSLVEPADVADRIYSAFRNDQRVAIVAVEQSLGDRDVGHKCVQVAIVDTNKARPELFR